MILAGNDKARNSNAKNEKKTRQTGTIVIQIQFAKVHGYWGWVKDDFRGGLTRKERKCKHNIAIIKQWKGEKKETRAKSMRRRSL